MSNELYHVLNRGVDKRRLFDDARDYQRFAHDLFVFNDTKEAPENHGQHILDFVSPEKDTRERLVDIHAWCLMHNHYHLLLSSRVDGGITTFLRKLNIGYAKYYNERHERCGFLYQGRTKKILIERNEHFLYMPHYIHLNPLDYLPGAENWRAGKIEKGAQCLDYLDAYRWSSFHAYNGISPFPSVQVTELFEDVFGGLRQATGTFLADMRWGDITALQLE